MISNNFVTLLKEQKVVIPPIQRDYAQGRNNDAVRRIRDRFLKNITRVLSDDYVGEPLKLDFIYGYAIDDETGKGKVRSIFKPLDGQQRLTTLFLIHWYAAVSEGNMNNECQAVLANFSYATRAKSRKFCEKLVEFRPDKEKNSGPIKFQIENQSWFFLSWANDPTIASMLIMLDAIETEFKANCLNSVWKKLVGDSPRIIFYLLNMEDLGLPEDLYIKMNSRGKALTEFEHFKSQFSEIISSDMLQLFKSKIDKDWSNLFWVIHKDKDIDDVAGKVDGSFLNFYNYITDFLIVTKEISVKEIYWLDIANAVYKNNRNNVQFLFKSLDTFVEQQKNNSEYFSQFLYINQDAFSEEKVRLFFNNAQINLFHKCAQAYKQAEGRNPFSIGEQLMLYAFMLNLQDVVNNFPAKIRRIRNLIASSEDQLRKEYLKTLYEGIKNIIDDKPISENARFSKHQILEETTKASFITQNESLKETLLKLEDHHLLRGSVKILGIDQEIPEYAPIFVKLFPEDGICEYFAISQAMMSINNYSQDYGGKWRRVGNQNDSTWRELFTISDRRRGFNETKSILKQYLKHFIDDTNASNDSIIESYCPDVYTWRYYFSKYKNFQFWNNNPTEGYYYWGDFENKSYDCYMMYRKQFNGRHWNPFFLELAHRHYKRCQIGDYGNNLQFISEQVILNIKMENNSFEFCFADGDEHSAKALAEIISKGILNEEGKIVIQQNNDGHDTENRIDICSKRLSEIEAHLFDRTQL